MAIATTTVDTGRIIEVISGPYHQTPHIGLYTAEEELPPPRIKAVEALAAWMWLHDTRTQTPELIKARCASFSEWHQLTTEECTILESLLNKKANKPRFSHWRW